MRQKKRKVANSFLLKVELKDARIFLILTIIFTLKLIPGSYYRRLLRKYEQEFDRM